ncbi:MAG: ABC transporter permease [Halanaerobiales bacterium]|nr:ABC transporter permease [Halanaerobiales bacterium]
MLKRIIAIVKRDFDNSIRDNLLLYALLAPVLIALIMRFFTPSVESSAISFAILDNTDQSIVDELSQYASIEYFKTEKALFKKVKALGDTVGVIVSKEVGEDKFKLIFEGNEAHDSIELSKSVIQTITQKKNSANIEISDLGKKSNIKGYLAAFLALASMLIGGMMIGLNIIDEKEEDTIRALAVSPLRRSEFVIARSVFGIFLSLILVFVGLWVLGVHNIPYLQVLFITVAGLILTVLFGFFLGSVSNNQINGIANLKIGALVFLLPAILTFIIPKAYIFVLYWLPTYWTFEGYKAIFVLQDSWNAIGRIGLWSFVTNIVCFMIMYSTLKKKLPFGRD